MKKLCLFILLMLFAIKAYPVGITFSAGTSGVDEAYGSGWNADTNAPEKDDVYDYLVNFDADADGSYADETWYTNIFDGTVAFGDFNGTDIIDSDNYNADSIDNEHMNWADIDNLGDEGSCTLSATATALATARAIGGVSFDGTAAITPTTIVVADTEDATAYVGLWDSATGSLLPKTDEQITYVANTGVLTAVGFAGALTGAVTGNADTCTTAGAGDAAVDFFGAGVDAVTDATTCTDVEGTGLSIAASTLNWSAASTDLTDTADLLYEAELDAFAELDAQIADKSLVNQADGATWTGGHDFGGADLELPQASPAAPDADGEVEWDVADGTLVIQQDTAHAELGADADIVVGKMIKSWSATIFEPDNLNDIIPLKVIEAQEFPHGVEIVETKLCVGTDVGYVLTILNYDDFDTVNAGDGTIDTVTYVQTNDGEVTDDTPTFSTIPAGQWIMLSIPATDVDWIHVEIYYYEPIA